MEENYTILFCGEAKDYSTWLTHLTESGYNLSIQSEISEAEVLEGVEDADLVLLEIKNDAAHTVLSSIRSEYSLMELPVIILTDSCDSPHVVKALNQGANDYINPPLDIPAVHCRIKNQLKLAKTELLLKESEERYALAAQAANEGLWDWQIGEDHVFVCSTWQRITGYTVPQKKVKKETWIDLVMDADRELYLNELGDLTSGESDRLEREHRIITARGEYLWVLTTATSVRDKEGVPRRIVGSIMNISGGRLHNSLTGLPNSLLIRDRIEQLLKAIRNNRITPSCILFIDINRFRYINQAYGMVQGDHILKETARRIAKEIRDDDTLSHPGRDEFIVIMEKFHDLRKVSEKIEQIMEAVNHPISLPGSTEKIRITTSIGIVIADEKYTSSDKVIQDAESAMSMAKSIGVNKYHFFSEKQYITVKETLKKEERLREALENKELELYYQPQIDLETGRIAGFEALVRWIDPERGMIYPVDFIPLAEESGIILELGDWVLEEACRQIVSWKEQGISTVKVSVNISPLQINQGNFAETVRRIIKQTAVPPELLVLEITESHAMEDPEESLKLMAELCSLGVQLSIDDFGTGYSSLAALRNFPVSTLKIDKSFIRDIPGDSSSKAIVKTIIAMARAMNFSTIAEGVENVNQLEYLQEIGCRSFQGFLKSRAVSPRLAAQFMTEEALKPTPYY